MKKAMVVLLAAALSATMSVPAFARPVSNVNAMGCELACAISAFINDCSMKVYDCGQFGRYGANGAAALQDDGTAGANATSARPYCNVEGCPGYTDANGDGICDHYADGAQRGYGYGYGNAAGNGNGAGNGASNGSGNAYGYGNGANGGNGNGYASAGRGGHCGYSQGHGCWR